MLARARLALVLAAAPHGVVHGRSTGSTLSPCDMSTELPTTTKCDPTGKKPIIIAGEGKTGTETMATVLAMLGLQVAHFQSLIQCCSKEDNLPLGGAGLAGARCHRPANGSTCNGITWMTPYLPYTDLTNVWNSMPTSDFDTFDWCQLNVADAYADVPMPSLTPYLYDAYGPGTKIIITEVPAVEWTEKRSEWDISQVLNDSAPLGYMFAQSINEAMANHSIESEVTSYKRSKSANAYAYIAERALIECVVRQEDVLRVNIAEEADDPQKLWKKISDFLGLPTTGIDTSLFPRDTPGSCHSWNTEAFEFYSGSAADQLAMVRGDAPVELEFNIPVPELAKPYFACPSSGQHCPDCRFNLPPPSPAPHAGA